jgi:aspartate-semialdehyde dehydrogenase
VVIDNSSLYRYDPDVPLIVPEVNADAIHGYKNKNIIANPNCSTAQMVVALKPLHDRAKIKRVVVATYQSVSGAGKEGMDELWEQTKAVYNPVHEVPPKKFSKQIAFNVIPHIDVFLDSGETKEEWKMVAETKKILDPSIKVTATCVRVPVFVGHSEAINIETEEFLDWQEAQDILREAPASCWSTSASPAATSPRSNAWAICDLCQPRAAGFDHRQRAEPVVRVGQPAQGRGAERGADQGRLERGSWPMAETLFHCDDVLWRRSWRCAKSGTKRPAQCCAIWCGWT